MATIGYARTSTAEQVAGLDAQKRDLAAAGCDRIFSEQVSSVAERAELKSALDALTGGDTLVVTKPDRLARSTKQLLDIVEDMEHRKIGLIFLSMGGQQIDSRSPTGKLMLTMLGAMAEFERSLMLERQREGIARAKRDGKYRGGRKPLSVDTTDSVKRLYAEGVTYSEIAARCGVGVASVWRITQAGKSMAA